IPARDADRQLKLGAGGLRDVEFAVQLLQLVHGRTDEHLRDPGTLQALGTLTARGYVGRDDGDALHAAYEFLRTLEHRIQLQHLAALGYADPAAALRHLEALTGGLSRTAAIQRALLPAMLEWFADAPDPDAGLFGFRRISESLGSTPWYLKSLRDEGQVAERLARVLATSRYASDLLEREPEGVRMLGEELVPSASEAILERMRQSADR